MKYFKPLGLPKFYDTVLELNKMIDSGIIHWGDASQVCLNSTNADPNNYTLGTASLYLDWDKSSSIINNSGMTELIVPRRDIPLNESDFTILCSQFKNTVFEVMYDTLKKEFNIGRVRLMKLNPKTCLSWHTDDTNRIHYPMSTQTGCIMIIEDEMMHIPENEWWFASTRATFHTAMNASIKSRIHLVASIID
jgi:hypothetical protein